MIQSDIFDSFNMNFKKIINSTVVFAIKRLIEIFGLIFFCLGILLFIAMASYSPEDPNFIFPKDTEIVI